MDHQMINKLLFLCQTKDHHYGSGCRIQKAAGLTANSDPEEKGNHLGKYAGSGADDAVIKIVAEGQDLGHQRLDGVEVLVLPHLLQ